ncbi:MAG: hypothetical protein R3277_07800 [Brumimicrobium sp.]|nr:hypothetical protein [Brumimicrobium sp.]
MIQRKLLYGSIILLLSTTTLNAQTKLIAHKSHSGRKSDFAKAYKGNMFDLGASNFGMAPEIHVRKAQLDSLIFVNDSVTIMVTSEHCYNPYDPRDRKKRNFKIHNAEHERAFRERDTDTTTIWQAGRTTVINHPVFNKSNPPEKIRKTVDQEYYFINPADKIVITDYNSTAISESEKTQPTTKEEKIKNDSGPSNFFKGLWITVCILVIGTLSYGTTLR